MVKTEGATFALVLLYIFIEYVRPQTIYPAIDIIPYGKVVIASAFIAYVFQKKKIFVSNISNKLIFSFLAVIIISSFLGLSLSISMSYWGDFAAWILIYYLIVNVVNNERRYLIFTLLFLLCSFKMAQYSLRGWITGGRGYSSQGFGGGSGWFHNSGEFGIQMCIYLPIAFYFYISLKQQWPKWKRMIVAILPLTGLTGVLTASNRGTLIGGIAVLIVIFIKSKNKSKALLALLLLTFIGFSLIPEEQKQRFQQAGEDKTSVARLEVWKKGQKMLEMFPAFGVGYKNWMIADDKFFDGKGLLPHNIFIECFSELGYSGLAVYILLIMSTLGNNSNSRRLVRPGTMTFNPFIYNMAHALDASLIGYLVSGFFVTVLYYPFFWINLSMSVALNNIARKEAKRADYEQISP